MVRVVNEKVEKIEKYRKHFISFRNRSPQIIGQ